MFLSLARRVERYSTHSRLDSALSIALSVLLAVLLVLAAPKGSDEPYNTVLLVSPPVLPWCKLHLCPVWVTLGVFI